MTEVFDDHLELRLVGYVSPIQFGFALPLFGSHRGANVQYVARCRPDGDPRGVISGFDVYLPEGAAPLPIDRPDVVQTGDPWLDVFVWEGDVMVGTPAQVWAALSPRLPELQDLVPLSVLDAALNADAPERYALAKSAMAYMTRRFDVARAERWREGTLRRQLDILLARLDPDLATPSIDRAPHLSFEGRRATARIPDALDRIEKQAELAAVAGELDQLARAMDVTIDWPEAAEGKEEALAPSLAPSAAVEGPYTDREPGNPPILILAIGRRAREIARLIEIPEWFPTDADPERLVTWNADGKPPPNGMIAVYVLENPVDSEIQGGPFETVIALVDDDLILRPTPGVDALLHQTKSLGRTRILVPALPQSRPPSSLQEPATAAWGNWGFHALLDTAQARSPFWWGNARRSLDRRIADILSAVACICLADPVTESIRKSSLGGLLTFSMAAGYVDRSEDPLSRSIMPESEWPALRMSSETAWPDAGDAGPRERAHFRQRATVALTDGSQRLKDAYVECRPVEENFESFAATVVREILGGEREWVRHGRDMSSPPEKLLEVLSFPRKVHTFRTTGNPVSLAVTAETPTLEALRAADRQGWRVVRYTDRETVRRLTTRKHDVHRHNLPAEVELGALKSSSDNRRLATRGVDTRDIIRLSPEQLHEWIFRTAPKDRDYLRSQIRPLRNAQDYLSPAEPAGFAFPRNLLADSRWTEEYTAGALAKVLDVGPEQFTQVRPYKRAADLAACWLAPQARYMRFAIQDGLIPTQVVPLNPEEVVLQTSFIVDGDWSVPALFRSRAFNIWAAATLSRSNSWMSRFSIGTTFGGFPLPSPFRVFADGDTDRAIVCLEPKIVKLGQELEADVRDMAGSEGPGRSNGSRLTDEIRNSPRAVRMDELILGAYDLPPDADDLSILDRLVAFNDRLAAR